MKNGSINSERRNSERVLAIFLSWTFKTELAKFYTVLAKFYTDSTLKVLNCFTTLSYEYSLFGRICSFPFRFFDDITYNAPESFKIVLLILMKTSFYLEIEKYIFTQRRGDIIDV